MHICAFSIVNYWQGVKGGMEIHGQLLSQGLVDGGHRVSIISTKHPDGKEIEEQEGVKIYYLPNTVFGSRRKQWIRESVRKFYELHRQDPFDVIWSQSFAANGLASSSRSNLTVPIIPILHGCIHQELNSFRTNLFGGHLTPFSLFKDFIGLFYSYYKQQKPLLSISDRIITVSQELVSDLRRWYGERIATKAVPVFNGIDPEVFRPDPHTRHTMRTKFQIQDDETLLMTSGALNKEKGHHLAIKSLLYLQREIPNTKLMIVGSGESRKFLEKLMRETALQDKVLFTGFVPNHEMVQYYNAADVYLMPTLRIEGLPFVLLEAMSCAKPVVATRTGGNTSIIKDGENGFLIEPTNIQQLIHYIMMILKDDKIKNRLSTSARKTILEDFTIDKMVDKTVELMREAIERYR
jgi:glycosyltransferase involved in cell wall biosynthesis